MAQEQVLSIGFSEAPPDIVWGIAREFSDAWHPAIDTIEAERGAQGATIRAFKIKDEETVYRERLTYFSDTNRTLAYSHLTGIRDVDRYNAKLTVTEADDGGSVITMSATLSADVKRAVEIAHGTKAIFDEGVAVLAKLSESCEPQHKVARSKAPVAIEDLLIDELPRLALSVTPEQDGPLCLFLHGIGGARTNWEAQLQATSETMRAAAMDLRGYGESTLGPEQSMVEDYCDDILRVAGVLDADQLVLCGLSYGSWIATSFAMRHPDRLAGLVLSGGCTGMSEAGLDEREAFRLSREVPLNAGQIPADFAPAVVKVIAGPNATEDTKATLLASMAAIPAGTYRDALMCFSNPMERFDFSKLKIPVLMMTGEHDTLAPPHEIIAVADRIFDSVAAPDVRYETIKDAGHVCNLEAPEAYNSVLTEFLRKVAP